MHLLIRRMSVHLCSLHYVLGYIWSVGISHGSFDKKLAFVGLSSMQYETDDIKGEEIVASKILVSVRSPFSRRPHSAGGLIQQEPHPAGGHFSRRPHSAGGLIQQEPHPAGGHFSRRPLQQEASFSRRPFSAGASSSRRPLQQEASFSRRPYSAGASSSRRPLQQEA
jgi:hypothetical protein